MQTISIQETIDRVARFISKKPRVVSVKQYEAIASLSHLYLQATRELRDAKEQSQQAIGYLNSALRSLESEDESSSTSSNTDQFLNQDMKW